MPALKMATTCSGPRLAVQLKECRSAHRAGASAPGGQALQRRAPQLTRRQAAGPRALSAQASSTAAALPALAPLDDSYESKCAFPGRFGNWLIPDTVLLGRYPFIEPGRCRSGGGGEGEGSVPCLPAAPQRRVPRLSPDPPVPALAGIVPWGRSSWTASCGQGSPPLCASRPSSRRKLR